MRKKISSILTIVLIVAICLTLFVSCASGKVSFFDYSEKNLGPVGKLVRLMHEWIGNYGWTVVVFTVFLKVIMLPLDFWQRYSTRKSAAKMQKIQPLLEAIDKRYGANTPRANEEKQKLYKKQGYSMLSSCLPMIISMIVFFVMFAGLREYSTYSTIKTFEKLSNDYYRVYTEELIEQGGENAEIYQAKYNSEYENKIKELTAKLEDGKTLPDSDKSFAELFAKIQGVMAVNQNITAKTTSSDDSVKAEGAALSTLNNNAEALARKTIQVEYIGGKLPTKVISIADNEYEYGNVEAKGIQESWLWIQNVWQPDTWDTVMPPYTGGMNANSFSQQIDMTGYPNDMGEATYNIIRQEILKTGIRGTEGKWNGLMILPILSIGLSFLSMFVSQLMEKKNRKGEVVQQNQQQAATNKTMMILMPLMMAYFGFIYTGAFAIYMVFNYMISIVSTVALRIPVEKLVEKNLAKGDKNDKSSKASYMR